jgi:hypothetical protein
MKYSPTLIHAVADYSMAALLLAAPWLCGFSHDSIATWCTAAFGLSTVAYNLFSDNELAIRRVIPMLTHLVLDVASGGLLIAAPFLLGFAATTWMPLLVLGCVEIGVALLSGLCLVIDRLGPQPRRGRVMAR